MISPPASSYAKADPRSPCSWRAASSSRRSAPIKRKIIEIVITFQLEHRFTKKQIFEMYANEINLGQRGSFSIDGFGEASQAYFGKDVRQLDLAECALLAGIIQSPNCFNPFRHADRAIERRNLVLDSMVETGAITKDQAERAKAEPLHLSAAALTPARRPTSSIWCTTSWCRSSATATSTAKACASTPRSIPICSAWPPLPSDSTIHVVDEQVDKLHARDKKLGKPYVYPQVALDRAQSPHRPGAGPGGRAQLWHVAGESRRRAAAHRLHLQAVRLRCGLSNRCRKAPCCRAKPSCFRR